MKRFLFGLLCGILAAGCLVSAELQEIKSVDGVKIIQNKKKPNPPKGVPTRFTADLEAVIGSSDDPEKAFSQLASFVVDEDGRIYALDLKEQKIKVFEPNGEFVLSFGKKGQGPGELQMGAGLHLAPNDTLAVDDALGKKIVYFTKDGEYIREVSYATRLALVNLLMDPTGNFLGREMKMEGQKAYFDIVKLDNEMNFLFSLDKVEFPLPLPGSGNKINLMDMMAIYQVDRSGNIYYGRNRKYEINVYTPEGKLFKSIRKDYSPQKITESDKEEILKRMENVPMAVPVSFRELFEFPKSYPPFQMFTIDENGRIIVRTWEKGKQEGEFLHDVFDPEGRFIARFPAKENFMLWKSGKAYATDEDEEGFNVIKKYTIRWERSSN